MKQLSLYPPNISFVLVEPLTAGNIGSAARAIKNMGFSSLRIVNPKCSLAEPELFWLAHGAKDIVEGAQVFATLQEAVADCSTLVGTSHKARRHDKFCATPRELGPKITEISQENRIAIIFGRENHGLSNDEIDLCHWIVNIPAATFHPSLNLAQAVMLVCYELFMTSDIDQPPAPPCVGF